jgi:hypothetical protein
MLGCVGVETGITLLTWAVGAAFGALWISLLEQGYKKRAQIYGFSMTYCYFVDAVFIQLWDYVSYRRLLALYLLAALFLVAVHFIDRRRRNRP